MPSGTNSRTCVRRQPAWIRTLPITAALLAIVASVAPLVAQSPASNAPAPSKPLAAPPASQPAQTAVSHPAHGPKKLAQLHKKIAATAPLPPQQALLVVPVPPPEPPKPNWPANDKAVPAKVSWDSQGLKIEADNSSLDQILSDIATDTGTKVDGRVGDERVFGSYGPGPARDVIAQLLDGTTYNVLMVGDQGSGTPREIVLSNRPNGPAPTSNAQNNNNNEVDETEYEPPQQPIPGTPPMRNGFGPQGMPPDQNQQPQEDRRAMFEQRMEQLRQQQQQQQEQQPQEPQQPPTPPQ